MNVYQCAACGWMRTIERDLELAFPDRDAFEVQCYWTPFRECGVTRHERVGRYHDLPDEQQERVLIAHI